MEETLGNGEDFFVPNVDIQESESAITFYAELPGVKQEDVEVELVGDRLTIKGCRELNREDKHGNYVSIERSYGSFLRTFQLDANVTAEKIAATFKDGILRVEVPKAATVKPKKVPIKA
jgi:HSP20 family protein